MILATSCRCHEASAKLHLGWPSEILRNRRRSQLINLQRQNDCDQHPKRATNGDNGEQCSSTRPRLPDRRRWANFGLRHALIWVLARALLAGEHGLQSRLHFQPSRREYRHRIVRIEYCSYLKEAPYMGVHNLSPRHEGLIRPNGGMGDWLWQRGTYLLDRAVHHYH